MTKCFIRLRAIGGKSNQDTNWEAEQILRIGRLEGLEVVLNDGSISRRHAEITLTERGWIARDLGSTNGTFVNGLRLGRTGQPLRANDLLQVGNIVLAVVALTDKGLDFTETPCGRMQVQAVARQSLAEAAEHLAMEVTQSTRPGEQLLNLLHAGQMFHWGDSLDAPVSRALQDTVVALERGAARWC